MLGYYWEQGPGQIGRLRPERGGPSLTKDPHVLVPPAPGLKVSCYKGRASPGSPGGTEFSRGRPSPVCSLHRAHSP